MARRRAVGQGLVEFALLVPLFFFIVFAIIDLARFTYLNSVLSNAAREAARVASVEAAWIGSTDPSCGTLGGPICPATVPGYLQDVTNAANRMTAPYGLVASVYYDCSTIGSAPTGTWTVTSCPTGARSGGADAASIRVTMNYQPITPIIAQIVPAFSVSATSTMVLN